MAFAKSCNTAFVQLATQRLSASELAQAASRFGFGVGLAPGVSAATSRFLAENKSPTRRLGGIDNRGSHFYLALYWAEALAGQDQDPDLKATFAEAAAQLAGREQDIVAELLAVQGHPADIGGYYEPSDDLATAAMRPSATFNGILEAI